MNKLYIILGVLAILVSFASAAKAEVLIVPVSQPACCEAVQYEVIITNDLKTSQVFNLDADSKDGIKVILQPDAVKIGSGESETLILIAKPDCGLASGEYEITVEAEYVGACEALCGDLCTYTYDASTVLRVPNGCVVPEAPVELEPELIPLEVANETNGNETETPTGAVIAPGDDFLAIGILFVLLAIFIVMLILIVKNSEKEEIKTKGGKATK